MYLCMRTATNVIMSSRANRFAGLNYLHMYIGTQVLSNVRFLRIDHLPSFFLLKIFLVANAFISHCMQIANNAY
jgi:hypothetical protein